MTSLKFRPDALMAAREGMGLNQLQLATLAEEASSSTSGPLDNLGTSERVRRVRTWQSRIGAWERGIDSPSAAHVPMLARLVDVSPLAFYDVDPGAPSFTRAAIRGGYDVARARHSDRDLVHVAASDAPRSHRALAGLGRPPVGSPRSEADRDRGCCRSRPIDRFTPSRRRQKLRRWRVHTGTTYVDRPLGQGPRPPG